MKLIFNIVLFLFFVVECANAQSIKEEPFFKEIDSIALTASRASHFASVYTYAMNVVDPQLQSNDSVFGQLTKKFELNFSDLFLKSCRNEQQASFDTIWGFYFTQSDLSSIQYKLIGINAHINGDLWKALVASFSHDELNKYGKDFFLYHHSLLEAYEYTYKDALLGSAKLRAVHFFSIGLDKSYGKLLLRKWRKRQIKLAINYDKNQVKFKRLLRRTERKKKTIDKMVLRL